MIKGIAKIKGYSVYENYVKPAGTQEFGVKNLIYGWNYSGKTSLSRLFAQIGNDKPNPDLSGCSYIIETDGEPITEANSTQSNLIVRVFNSDFVRENLNFTGGNFNPILLLGKDTDDAQKKLTHCEELSKRTQDKIKNFTKEVSDLESSFSAAKTSAAANIKKNLALVEAYTATHLSSDIKMVSSLGASQLLPTDIFQDDLKLAHTRDNEKPSTVDRIDTSPAIDSLYNEAVKVLAATPNLSSTIKHLEEKPLLERWVETGLSLHIEPDKCQFCGGDLSKQRLAELQAHFSKDLAEHKNKVEQLHNRVKSAKVSIQLPKEKDFNPQFRDRFSEASSLLPKAIDAFNKAVETLASDVQRKQDAPFKAQVPTALPDGLVQAITDSVKSINQVIDDNNQIAINFTEAKRDAVKRVRLHYVQEFIDEQATIGREVKVARLNKKLERRNRLATAIQQETDKLRAIISQAQLGREEINKRLLSMLGSEAVQIKVVPEGSQERFQLVRKNGKIAKNLSDGERTAIVY